MSLKGTLKCYLYGELFSQAVHCYICVHFKVCKTVIKWMDCADIVEILQFFLKYWLQLLIFYVLIVLRQVTMKISIIQQFPQQYYCECSLLYRLLLQVGITDRCANSEFYSNLNFFLNKVHIFSIVVINRKCIQTLSQTSSYDRKNNHNSYLIYFW